MMKKYISIFFIFNYLFSFEISDAIGYNGAVASSKKEASDIGIEILQRGGNAIDAAVAVGFALSVVHPSAGNIGGGGFMVIRFSNGEVTTIDFRETAPLQSSRNMFLDDKLEVVQGMSKYSGKACGVPGTVYGLGYAHEKYGTMSWESLLYPSIQLAKYGFSLDYHNFKLLNSPRYSNFLSQDAESKKIFTKNNEPYKLNELFIQSDLAHTLIRIAKYGYNEFYNGITADYIVDCMNRVGGIITHEDLKSYRAIEREPIKINYRNHVIYSMPLPSSGGITLSNILNQIENVNLSEFEIGSAKFIHLLSEVEKRSYADRAEFLGDSDFINVPLQKLISKEYADDRFSTISMKKAIPSKKIGHGSIDMWQESEETTHFSIVDKYGNAVSLTTTVNGWFGNGITVDNAGFLLNNEMDDFSIKPGYPNLYGLVGNEANSIQPNKRMLSSMTPTIVENENNELLYVLGTPGGSTIITSVAQILINLIDFNMPLKEAVSRKRFHHQWLPDVIQVEKNYFSPEVIRRLEKYGHKVSVRSSIGEANCIYIDESGLKYSTSDSRRGGVSKAY